MDMSHLHAHNQSESVGERSPHTQTGRLLGSASPRNQFGSNLRVEQRVNWGGTFCRRTYYTAVRE